MHFESACSFGSAVAENLVWPPTFKIATAPHRHALHMGNLQCTIDQITARPFRRAHVPIRVIVKRDENHGLGHAPNPERSQIMKITRAVENKWRHKLCFVFAVKLCDQTQRRGEAQFRPPIACIHNRQTKWLIPPRVVKIEVKSSAGQKITGARPEKARHRRPWQPAGFPRLPCSPDYAAALR